jgi:hypothetical protein
VPLLADGPEVFGQQPVQRVGVGGSLGLVEGAPEPVNIGDHGQIVPARPPGRNRDIDKPCGAITPVGAYETVRVILNR